MDNFVSENLNTIRLENVRALAAVELKNELINSGLTQGTDFQWVWHPSQAPTHAKPAVEFIFKDPTLATFYALKWT
jgi:hypothetical protein